MALDKQSLPLVVNPTAAEAPTAEDTVGQVVVPKVPAIIDHVLTVGGAVGTMGDLASTTWTTLEPLCGFLSAPVLGKLVKSRGHFNNRLSALIPFIRSTHLSM